jgi:hypothetical protein
MRGYFTHIAMKPMKSAKSSMYLCSGLVLLTLAFNAQTKNAGASAVEHPVEPLETN